jgi:CHAT domain-containing protein/Tfp pilus assembly protein PilF
MTHQYEHRSATDGGKRPIFYRSLANFLALSLFSSLSSIAASPLAFGSEAGQRLRSAQVTTFPQDGAAEEKDVRPLEQGHPVKRELGPGQRHSYRLMLGAGQFLKAIIEQQGIDVVAQISGPDGKLILEFDSEHRLRGQEQASLAAKTAGDYRLILRPRQKEAAAGRYEIRIEELRAATENDYALQEAYKQNVEALKLQRAGKYDEALSSAERALETRKRILGPDHREVADSINSLAIMYSYKGEYAKAESMFQSALAIRERALEPEHPDIAASLNNLALLYWSKCEYPKAEPLFQRSLDIWEKALSPEHPDIAFPLNNLALLYNNIGEYAKAEPLYQRALAIREKALGSEHPLFAISLNNLANLYRNKGDYAKAEPLYQRALAISEKILAPEHPDFALYLNNLAVLYYDLEEYAKAEPLYQRAMAIREKALGQEHPLFANSLDNLANLYLKRGDYAKAEPLFQRALAIVEKILGQEHTDYALCLNNLAILYCYKGDYAKAEPLLRRALAIWEKLLGPNHPRIAESLNNFAELYLVNGNIAQAIASQSRANVISERNFALNLATGSERQKLAYLSLFSKQTDFTLSLHSQAAPNDPQALSLAFTTLLRRKGRGLDAMADTIATLRRHATPQDQDLFDQLTAARSQLAALILSKSDSTQSETYRTGIKPLEERVENLEAELSARSAEFRAQTQLITTSAVQSAIPPDSVLIEYVAYTPREPWTGESKPSRYLAYLLASRGQPKWVDLGEAAPIERAVGAWRQSLRENGVDVKQLGRAMDELVMRPVRSSLQSELGQIRHLLIAPDGSLNLIPFAALVDEENRYLIERYAISNLTSGRDLLRLRNSLPSKSSPLILANPIFGRMASAATRGSQNSVKSSSGAGAGGKGGTQCDPTRICFPQLPGTEVEALAIKATLPEASLLLRQRATEAALKQVIGPRILHIATHGFFIDYKEPARIDSQGIFEPALAQANPYTVQLQANPELDTAQETIQRLRERGVDAYILKSKVRGKGVFFRVRTGNFPTRAEAQKYGADLEEKGVADEFFVARYWPPQGGLIEPAPTIAQVSTKPAPAPSTNSQPIKERFSDLRLGKFAARVKDPLLRSGLALAGANEGKSGNDDGLLTALEVAGLDLWGTKLVVLSACDTGLGEVKNGEGVQGLRRALVLAGSESQVISLWEVPDELAKDIIIPYYKALRRGEGRGEGLRQVQLRMLRSRDLCHPFYWATFIQSGEWANLDGRR